MKKRVCLLCVLYIFCVYSLFACGIEGENSKIYTYDDLTKEEQIIIDNIYENYGIWESVYDTGRYIEVTNINFMYEDDMLLFVACYSKEADNEMEETESALYFYKILEVGENGELKTHTYENALFDKEENTNKRKAMMSAVNGFRYQLDSNEQKDVLANAFYKAQEGK